LLRAVLGDSGAPAADRYSTHSLRRGFANWANGKGWDLKTLVAHVGWRNLQSAVRYIEGDDQYGRARIERGLSAHGLATAAESDTPPSRNS